MTFIFKRVQETRLRRRIAGATRFTIHKIAGAICDDIRLMKIAITEMAHLGEDWAIDTIADVAGLNHHAAVHGVKILKNLHCEHAVWAITHIAVRVPSSHQEAVQALRAMALEESLKGGPLFMATCAGLASLMGTRLTEEIVRQNEPYTLIAPQAKYVMLQHQA